MSPVSRAQGARADSAPGVRSTRSIIVRDPVFKTTPGPGPRAPPALQLGPVWLMVPLATATGH